MRPILTWACFNRSWSAAQEKGAGIGLHRGEEEDGRPRSQLYRRSTPGSKGQHLTVEVIVVVNTCSGRIQGSCNKGLIWSLCVVVPSEALRTEEADLYDRGLWVTPAFQYARGSHQTDHHQSQGQSTPRSRSSNSAFSLALPSSSLKCAVALTYRKISLHIQCFVKDFCVYVCNYRWSTVFKWRKQRMSRNLWPT